MEVWLLRPFVHSRGLNASSFGWVRYRSVPIFSTLSSFLTPATWLIPPIFSGRRTILFWNDKSPEITVEDKVTYTEGGYGVQHRQRMENDAEIVWRFGPNLRGVSSLHPSFLPLTARLLLSIFVLSFYQSPPIRLSHTGSSHFPYSPWEMTSYSS